MTKIWNKWLKFIEKVSTVETSMIKRMMQILLFYILVFSLAILAYEINRWIGLAIIFSIYIFSALIMITLFYSVIKESIKDIRTKPQENE